jgi:hypothetical protein
VSFVAGECIRKVTHIWPGYDKDRKNICTEEHVPSHISTTAFLKGAIALALPYLFL